MSELPDLRGWPALLADIARHPSAGGVAAALRLAGQFGGQRVAVPMRAAGSVIERELGGALAEALVEMTGGEQVDVPSFHARLAIERRRHVLTYPGRSANDLARELGISRRRVLAIRAEARVESSQLEMF